jgi:cell pole-organizing protein PopZ
MAEAKTQAGDEPSMEEILQSIKKIISDDEQPAKPVEAAPAEAVVPGSDVLELTDAIEEPAAVEAAAPVPTPAASAQHNDVLNKIDEAIAVEQPMPAQPNAQDMPHAGLISEQVANAASSAFKKLQAAAEPPLPPLHTTPSPAFISGRSVEDMVMEMLKPMMKDWLDKNLPGIVERIVTVEIRKLTK